MFLELLHNVKPAPSHLTIKLPNGATAHISHIGDTKLSCGLILQNIFFVPQFTHNLLSVTKLTKDNKCDVLFGERKCLVVNSESKMIVCAWQLRKNLYYLSDKVFPGAESNMCNATSKSNSFVNVNDMYTTWHNRFGHASDFVLKFVNCVKTLIPHQPKVCLICPMSKFTKLPYTLSSSHAEKSFDLVHVDTWGPYKVCTKQKYKYFLTLVDDNSRVTWLYLMQHKPDYSQILQTFHNYVANHFLSSIKTIKSDNAPEFSDYNCKNFMADHGIIHQQSCAYMPQQNARVE